ncbi:hypothetical protein L6164_024323 [Bauhinia variegata]|uniref:Uncharacterized protein n=1 Tax=Bauhinia variegata TaxID=167791 RepID=A0ACB9LY17_BAUVA|nr:hypothetical protein L6164_024323 [Bauhinia variegata]
MELHLSLALPTCNPVEGCDQKNHVLALKQKAGSELWAPSCRLESKKHFKNKRSFQDSFGQSLTVSSDSLLVWSGQPNEEDERNGKKNRNTDIANKNDNEKNQVVGWPPIKEWRKKILHLPQHHGGQIRNDRGPAENKGRGSNSLYVKVKMEGVAIGRKIDLRLYNSYRTLTSTLVSMFANYQKLKEEGTSYTLTYQDEEGDWLLAGDVPWQSFIDSVQRLEILRNGNETT